MSMGWAAARKLRRAVDGLTRVVAIELLTAARSLDLRRPLEPAAPRPAPCATRCATTGARAGPGPAPGAGDRGRRGRGRSGRALAAAESVLGPLA